MKPHVRRKHIERGLPPGSSHFLRCFLEWLRANQGRFAIPVSVAKLRASGIELVFPSTTGCIRAYVHDRGNWHEIIVWARWKADWDIIHDSDVIPLLTDRGYVCELCMEQTEAFPSLEALWTCHGFECFLQWVNERLAKSRFITFTGSRGCFSADLSILVRNNRPRKRRILIAHVPFAIQPKDSWYMARPSGEIRRATGRNPLWT